MIVGTPLRVHNRPKPARPGPAAPSGTENSVTPGSSQPCPARPPPSGGGRWRSLAAETSAGQTIGALCGPLELTGPELRYCVLRHTHADELCWRRDPVFFLYFFFFFFLLQGSMEQMTGLSAFHANLLSFKLL